MMVAAKFADVLSIFPNRMCSHIKNLKRFPCVCIVR